MQQDRSVVEAKVTSAILKVLAKKDKKIAQITRISSETKITEDLGFDPVDRILLSLELEDAFGLDYCKDFNSVGEIVDYMLNPPEDAYILLFTETELPQPAPL